MKKRFTVWFLAVALVLPLFTPTRATTTYTYPVQGGNLKFNPSTGTITDCGSSVTVADIPSEIYGIPVTTIGNNAFYACGRLTSVTIPTTVTTIGMRAFYGCSALKSIVIPSSVTTIKGETYGAFQNCSRLESATIPGSVKRLPNYMFAGCTNLKSVTLGLGIEEIGWHAFESCKSLTSITIPDSVKSIEAWTFYHCNQLVTATIGSGVETIKINAFNGTKRLESLYFRGDAPSAASRMITQFANGFTIYYPEGASGWTTPTWNGYITKSYSLSSAEPTQPVQPTQPTNPVTPTPAFVTAVPTASTVYVNGTSVGFDAYNIGGNNYFKLRDLAFILSGSEAQFEVGWNSAANSIQLTTRKPYTPVGGEMAKGSGINQIGEPTSSSVYLNGVQVSFTAYNINGNNYFKLRDIGQAINFSVEWDGIQNCIRIDTSMPYRAE